MVFRDVRILSKYYSGTYNKQTKGNIYILRIIPERMTEASEIHLQDVYVLPKYYSYDLQT
jgi:hypothetical protein